MKTSHRHSQTIFKGMCSLPIVILIIMSPIIAWSQNTNIRPNIKVGVILPLTKDYSFLGEPIKNAILLAKTQIGENTKYEYNLIIEDGQLDPQLTAAAAQKLINIDKVDAIITFNSGVGNIVSPLAQANKIIHMGIASDQNVAKGEYNFIHWTQPEEEARVFVSELRRRGIKRLAVLGVLEGGGENILNSVKNSIKGSDISIVSEEMFITEESDFRTTFLKSQQQKPDIYLILVGTNRLDLIAKQRLELGIKTPLTSIETFEFTKNPSQLEGMWYVQAAEASSNFLNIYRKTYVKDPTVGAPNAFDEFNLIVTAYEAAETYPNRKPTSNAVIEKLLNIKDFAGALGPLSVSPEGIVNSLAIVKEIRDGKFIALKK